MISLQTSSAIRVVIKTTKKMSTAMELADYVARYSIQEPNSNTRCSASSIYGEKRRKTMEENDLIEEEIEEEEREYTPEELGIDYEMTYFDKNKEELYYEREVENEVQ